MMLCSVYLLYICSMYISGLSSQEEVCVVSAGHLSVMAADNPSEREVMEAESPGSASDLNRSDLDPIYIGGLPASRPIR